MSKEFDAMRLRVAEAIFTGVMSGDGAASAMMPREVEGVRVNFPTEQVQRMAERAVFAAHVFAAVYEQACVTAWRGPGGMPQ